MEKGIKEGIKEGMEKAAQHMKLKGMDASTIAEITGLSLDQISAL